MAYIIGFLVACILIFIIFSVNVIRKQKKIVREHGYANTYFSSANGQELYKLNQFRYQFDDERQRDLDNILDHARYLLEENNHFDYPKNHPIFSLIRTFTMQFQTNNDLNVLKQKGDRIAYRVKPNKNDTFHYISAQFEFFEQVMRDYRFQNDKNIKVDSPIRVTLAKTPIISGVWRDDRLLGSLANIGSDVQEKNNYLVDLPEGYELKTMDFKQDDINHLGAYLYPLGYVYIYNGNHSINAGIMKSEGEIKIDEIYDLRGMYEKFEFNGTYLLKSNSTEYYRIPFELGALFEIGRILQDYPNLFPQEVIDGIEQAK